MSVARVSVRPLMIMLGLAMLAALLPGSALAAPEGRPQNYIVRLAVLGADKAISPSSRSARKRIRDRAERTRRATDRISAEYGVKPRYRYTHALSGFSARMTPQQAARIARDAKVASVRPARRITIAGQIVPDGIRRVKAAPGATPAPDVDVDIAILDTGIGPVGGSELNVVGGKNCADDQTLQDYDPGDWEDKLGHGTHVAGIAAARDNGIGVVGVAPGARLWSVRVFDASGIGDETTIICGLDWAINTRDPVPPPDTEPIDVINMSIQGARVSGTERCPDDGSDLLHVAVCNAYAAGISMVAAAGNDAINANDSVPGGYDQVITVGALSDFDGLGWGKSNTVCEGETDDTYAGYSNYGRDVDIVAPGTCVRSTKPTASGDDTQVMTGTSMAAPHVTGAVARYLADHPGTSPDRMRKLVRAAGRMDWDIRSDPVWSGVNDPDAPNRVLDVKALTGPHDVRVWLSHDSFKVGTTEKSRTTRVDVQRAGGYDGDVGLSVSGLPGAVGSATFAQSNLSGLPGLGTNLHLALETDGPDGVSDIDVAAQGPGGDPSGNRALSLLVDRTGPVIDHLKPRARGGQVKLGPNGSAQAYLQWSASDALSTVKNATLRRKPGSQAWRDVSTTSGSSVKVTLTPGRDNLFKVKVLDSLGNKTTSAAVTARLSVRDSGSTQWLRPASGGWRTKAARKAQGGSLLLADQPAESLVTQFSGKAFAVVAPVGPNRGTLRVRIDAGEWREVSLKATKGAQRRVVFSRGVEDGSHTVEIEGFKGQTAVDAILIIR